MNQKRHISVPIMFSIFLIILSLLIGAGVYNKLPEKVASHWNLFGYADGYSSKFTGVFVIPIMSIFLLILLFFIPMLDPMIRNVHKFREYYEWFILTMVAFLFYLFVLVILWNLNVRFNFNAMMSIGFAFLFYQAGNLIEHSKMNWFIGIRTPWTLSNERVWEKVHILGGKMFKICAGVALIGLFVSQYAMFFILCPVMLTAISLVVYSYFAFKKETYQ